MIETDWWWIDYLESDLDPATVSDIEYLLENSESDRDEFEKWRVLKAWVKDSDPANKKEVLWSAQELNAHKASIMNALNNLDSRDEAPQVSLRLL